MNRTLLARTSFIVTTFAVLGLLIGVLCTYAFTGRAERFAAQATLAMLPGPEVAVADTPAFWEVLNAGQATRSAAIVLADSRWLDEAALTAGVSKSTLSLTAGAIPQTTLITVTMKADSAGAADAALDAVLADAIGLAATVSGPFRLQTVTTPTAQSVGPKNIQVLGAMGIAGLLLGAGGGFLISRSPRERLALGRGEGIRRQHPRKGTLTAAADRVEPVSVELQAAARRMP